MARCGPREEAPKASWRRVASSHSAIPTLLFFGAFFPQFMDPAGDHGLQIAAMGATAMAFAAVADGLYAVASARAGRALSARRVRLLSRIGGGFLIGGGVWLTLSRAK
jgi:homoserine/homoserine lactone efflux protein